MTPVELHSWLVARWTEHRALAQEATPGPWTVRIGGMGIRPHLGTPLGQMAYAWVLRPDGYQIAERHNGGTVEDLDHIAANDPSHVIAVCDAALRRLLRHQPFSPGLWEAATPRPVWCRSCTSAQYITWPCPEVLDDAAPWAERDDFPEELRHG